MDMNDMQYVVIVKTQATHVTSEKSKTYVSRADLRRGFRSSRMI
jgi:hypothetical protein